MASIKNLKKDINYVLGDIIAAADLLQDSQPESAKEAEAIIDDAIATFDYLIAQINNKKVENRKAALVQVEKQLEEKAVALITRVNQLGA